MRLSAIDLVFVMSFDKKYMKLLRKEKNKWDRDASRFGERRQNFTTSSGIPVKRLYTPLDLEGFDYLRDLGFPGTPPYTRGVYYNMYRGRLWTMRQYAGYGTAEETNRRFKYLLELGQTGLSVAFDLPTQVGIDPDHPLAIGEVGRVGVSVPTLKDMERLFDGIPLEKVSTSMTINATAHILQAMYIAVGQMQRVSLKDLSGTVQNDILKEYVARGQYIFPPEPSMRLVVDIIEYSCRNMPRWNFISVSGYHMREAGCNAIQEIAFTFANAVEYVKAAIDRGLDVDEFAPRISFFFGVHNDFFEEIAKFRAARRLWARIMREKFDAKNPRSMRLRFHVQTCGSTLTAQQSEINIVRVAIQALAAVLGGAQSIHTNSFDETLCLPTEEAVRIALRTQQIIAYESGVADVVDPLGGSYYLEWLTDEIEERAWKYIDAIDSMGGMIRAIEKGYPQREVAESAYKYQHGIDTGRIPIVGVNCYQVDESEDWVPINPAWVVRRQKEYEEKQLQRLRMVKATRNSANVESKLEKIRKAAEKGENVFPYVIDAVKAYATLGEVCGVLREVYGEWREIIII